MFVHAMDLTNSCARFSFQGRGTGHERRAAPGKSVPEPGPTPVFLGKLIRYAGAGGWSGLRALFSALPIASGCAARC